MASKYREHNLPEEAFIVITVLIIYLFATIPFNTAFKEGRKNIRLKGLNKHSLTSFSGQTLVFLQNR